jgi:hypothetical protein
MSIPDQPRTREKKTGMSFRRISTRTIRSAGITWTVTSEESTVSPLIVWSRAYS